MYKIKQRLVWILLFSTSFLILLILNGFSLKYFLNLMKNYKEILKKESKYTEDGDYYLIHKNKRRN